MKAIHRFRFTCLSRSLLSFNKATSPNLPAAVSLTPRRVYRFLQLSRIVSHTSNRIFRIYFYKIVILLSLPHPLPRLIDRSPSSLKRISRDRSPPSNRLSLLSLPFSHKPISTLSLSTTITLNRLQFGSRRPRRQIHRPLQLSSLKLILTKA